MSFEHNISKNNKYLVLVVSFTHDYNTDYNVKSEYYNYY